MFFLNSPSEFQSGYHFHNEKYWEVLVPRANSIIRPSAWNFLMVSELLKNAILIKHSKHKPKQPTHRELILTNYL